MEDEEAKSAFELAMERISGMPKLTPEEKAEQKEKEFRPIGTAIAVKYMDGKLDLPDLPGELTRYPGDQQPIVRRALIAGLCRELRLENSKGRVKRAFNGLAQITSDTPDAAAETEKNFLIIAAEFEAAKAAKLSEFEVTAAEAINALGISGSAIRLNLAENALWKNEQIALQQAFAPRIDRLVSGLQDARAR